MRKFTEYIAWRYLLGRQKRRAHFSNILNIIGITLGIFAILTVTSVMNGFDRDIRNKILAFRSDIKIRSNNSEMSETRELLEEIRDFAFVRFATPVIENELLIQSTDGISGTLCYGIEYESYSASTKLQQKMLIGNPQQDDFQQKAIILGIDLAIMLNVTVGEYVQLSSALGTEVTPLGLLPRTRRYQVKGIFSSGIPEYDLNCSYISLEDGQYFSGRAGAMDFIEVRTENAGRSAGYRRILAKELGKNVTVSDWSEYEANLFNAIFLEKILMIIVLFLIILLAGFNIAGNLNRLVAEKRRDFGILRSWGVEAGFLRRIVLQMGMFIGTLGITTGLLAAGIFLSAQAKYEFIKIPVAGFPIDSVPVEIRLSDFIIIPLLALLIVLFSTLAPASKAMKLPVIRILREN